MPWAMLVIIHSSRTCYYFSLLAHGLNFGVSLYMFSSDFEELEAVPNLAIMDGPLEPPTSSDASILEVHAPDDSFVNFFSVSTLVKSHCRH